MSILLHKRIHIDLLKKPRPDALSRSTDPSMDVLPVLSQAFLVAAEETVAALYSPQDVPTVTEAVTVLGKSAAGFRSPLETARFIQARDPPLPQDAIEEVIQKVASVTVTETPEAKKQRETQKWFDTCFNQVDKLSQKVLSGLRGDATS